MIVGCTKDPRTYEAYATTLSTSAGAGRWIPAGGNGYPERLVGVRVLGRAQSGSRVREHGGCLVSEANRRGLSHVLKHVCRRGGLTGVDRGEDGPTPKRVVCVQRFGHNLALKNGSVGCATGWMRVLCPCLCHSSFRLLLGFVSVVACCLPTKPTCLHSGTFSGDQEADPDATANGWTARNSGRGLIRINFEMGRSTSVPSCSEYVLISGRHAQRAVMPECS